MWTVESNVATQDAKFFMLLCIVAYRNGCSLTILAHWAKCVGRLFGGFVETVGYVNIY